QHVDAHCGANGDAELDLIVERLPGDQEVRCGVEPCTDGVGFVGRLQSAPCHDTTGCKGVVELAFDEDGVAHRPVDAQAWHCGVVRRRLEKGTVATEGHHKITGMVAAEPDVHCKAAGNPTGRHENVRLGR